MTSPSSNSEHAAATQTIYVFRHAEKVASKPDPELSEMGQQRAENLAKLLKNAEIQHTYATKYQRTQQTAQPLAKQSQQAITTYAAGDTVGLVQQVRAHGQTTLIVGHSNTVPDIVRALGGTAPELTESDYGDLFVVHINQRQVTTLRLYVAAN